MHDIRNTYSLQKAGAIETSGLSAVPQASHLPFYLLLFSLVLEFGRPQESIPGLGSIHLPAIITILLGLSIIFSTRLRLSDSQTRLFVLLLALMVLHVPIAVNNYYAFHTARGMLITFVTYLGIISFVNSFRMFKALINIWLGIHVYLAIIGIMKGGLGIGGFLGDENDFCLTLNMVIPFAFFMAISETNKAKKTIYIGLTLLFLFVNMLTLSRGGFVGLVAVGIYCWLKSPKKVLSAVFIAMLVLFMSQYATDKYWGEIRSIQEEGASKGTGEERVYEWKVGWKMFLDNPILGVGQGNFPWQFGKYEKASGFYDGLHGKSRAGRAAHSLYFTLLPELGIIGTLLFAGMLYYTYRDIRLISRLRMMKPIRPLERETDRMFYLSRALECGIIGFLVSGTFISVLYYPNFWMLMGFTVALRKVSILNYENHLTSN